MAQQPFDFPVKELFCGFCGKKRREVHVLIRGPYFNICDECVQLCTDMIAEAAKKGQAQPKKGR